MPPGVRLRALPTFSDARGMLAEFFRADWPEAIAPVQWVTVVSAANVLRGVHVHVRHSDWLVVSGRPAAGRAARPARRLAGAADALSW